MMTSVKVGKGQPLILLDQAGDFGLDGFVGLAVQHAGRVPVDKADEREGRKRKDREIDGDDAKRLGAEDR